MWKLSVSEKTAPYFFRFSTFYNKVETIRKVETKVYIYKSGNTAKLGSQFSAYRSTITIFI